GWGKGVCGRRGCGRAGGPGSGRRWDSWRAGPRAGVKPRQRASIEAVRRGRPEGIDDPDLVVGPEVDPTPRDDLPPRGGPRAGAERDVGVPEVEGPLLAQSEVISPRGHQGER